MRYENRLAAKVEHQEEQKKLQEKLRKKFDVKEEGIIQVVKKRLSEVFIDKFVSLGKTVLWILIRLLATIGALSLLYPDTRQVLYCLGLDLVNQTLILIGR